MKYFKILWKSIPSRSDRPSRKPVVAAGATSSVQVIESQMTCKHELLEGPKSYNSGNAKFPLQSRLSQSAFPENLSNPPKLPFLPTEIWIEILKEALTPQFAFNVDVENAPHAIEAFHTALTTSPYINPAFKAWKMTEVSVRLVCWSWKVIADGLQKRTKVQDHRQADSRWERDESEQGSWGDSAWITEFSIDKAASYGPCKRLDVTYHDFPRDQLQAQSNGNTNKYQYQYDIDVIRIRIRSSAFLGLSTMLTRPSTLQALYISLNTGQRPIEFPLRILEGLSTLRTLGIGADGVLQISGRFVHPTITTLILDISEQVGIDLEHWIFPNLHTFSIHIWNPMKVARFGMEETDGSISKFIKRHSRGLRSLRFMPSFPLPFLSANADAPEFPELEALATDFVVESVDLLKQYSFAFPKLKHLVQKSSNYYSQKMLFSTLLDLLVSLSHSVTWSRSQSRSRFRSGSEPGSPLDFIHESDRRVESITLTEVSYLYKEIQTEEDEKDHKQGLRVLQKFDKYCETNGIRVYGYMGKLHCCVYQAWKELNEV